MGGGEAGERGAEGVPHKVQEAPKAPRNQRRRRRRLSALMSRFSHDLSQHQTQLKWPATQHQTLALSLLSPDLVPNVWQASGKPCQTESGGISSTANNCHQPSKACAWEAPRQNRHQSVSL